MRETLSCKLITLFTSYEMHFEVAWKVSLKILHLRIVLREVIYHGCDLRAMSGMSIIKYCMLDIMDEY